jgi:hypothetical protein
VSARRRHRIRKWRAKLQQVGSLTFYQTFYHSLLS